ncbi:MAG: MATE family efflux transporter [Saccharofermentanales bacterium]|jgi:putative MATE family efflux protein
MHAEKSQRLLKGPILATLVKLAMPIMASSFLGLAYTLTDMFWVASLGERAVAAVGSGGTLIWLVDSLFALPRVGGQVLVGQSLGAGDRTGAKDWARTILRLGYAMAIVIMAIFLFLPDPLTAVFRFNDADTIVRTSTYIRLIGIGMIPKVGVRLYSAMLTASGNSTTPLIVYTVGLVLNMALDPLLIRVVGMDVAGAAVATVVAETVTFLLMLWAVRNNPLFSRFRLWHPPFDLKRLGPVARLGAPVSIQSSVHALATVFISRQIVRFGDLAVAAQRLGAQIESISWMTADGFGVAVNAFMSQNVGARAHDRVRRGYWAGFWLVSAICTATTLILYFLGGPIVQLFFDDPEALMHGTTYLHVLSASQLLMGIQLLTSSAFAALGQTLFPSIVVTALMVARLPLGAWLSQTPLGVNGIWWSFTITTNLAGLILAIALPIFMRQNKAVIYAEVTETSADA